MNKLIISLIIIVVIIAITTTTLTLFSDKILINHSIECDITNNAILTSSNISHTYTYATSIVIDKLDPNIYYKYKKNTCELHLFEINFNNVYNFKKLDIFNMDRKNIFAYTIIDIIMICFIVFVIDVFVLCFILFFIQAIRMYLHD